MQPETATTETPEELLSGLHPDDRELIEGLMEDHPGLTAAKAIEICAYFGGMHLSSPEARERVGRSKGT
jgi:hypothetical protein